MASSFLHIGEFDKAKEDIVSYLERFDEFLSMYNSSENYKVSMLIASIGPEAYTVLKNLTVPELPKQKNYEQLVTLLKNHYTPKKLLIAERFRFHKRNQNVDESISDYILTLKKLASTCEFKAHLDDALRDRFVCGLLNEHIQQRLLVESKLTFESACATALNMEMAQMQSKILNPSTSSSVSKVVKASQSRRSHKLSSQESQQNNCSRCGRFKHSSGNCPAVNWTCFKCNKKGHTSFVCKSKIVKNVTSDNTEGQDSSSESSSSQESLSIKSIQAINESKNKPLLINVTIENIPIKFEVDSGASVSVLPISLYEKYFYDLQLSPCRYNLKSVNGQKLKLQGQIKVSVCLNKIEKKLQLVIVNDEIKMPLLGRTWLDELLPDWRNLVDEIKEIKTDHKFDEVLSQVQNYFPNIISKNNTPIKFFKANIVLKENAIPVFHKPYAVPFALKKDVEDEIQRLCQENILEPVKFSSWASPIVIVPRKNGKIRICCDFKKTLNPNLHVDYYPLPKLEDIFSSLCGGKYFVVLDLTNAYLQLSVDENCKSLVINTHLGLYKFKRLPYGCASAPAIFQGVMDEVLKGLDNTVAYLDDILISGSSLEDCKIKTVKVFERLNEFNIKINFDKCNFFNKHVEYLGHTISEKGIRPTTKKMEAIISAPEPTNVTELKAFLGLINFYHKFLPNSSTVLKPLYDLTKKNTTYEWNMECQRAFDQAKKLLVSNNVLTHFDLNKPLVVCCDASNYGVGAVLSHIIEGEERPILFVSCTLTEREQKYSQLEKEALAIIFALKRFHRFLYGNKFTIITDHQPLKFILDPRKNIPTLASARIQRWAIILSSYNYTIQYKKGSQISHADALSRMPVEGKIEEHVRAFSLIDELPITYEEVAKCSTQDPLMCKVYNHVRNGWPNHVNDVNLKPFFLKRNELSIEANCLMLGHRVIIPVILQDSVLNLLHEGHPGIVRAKSLARSFVWWPQINSDLELKIKTCETCQVTDIKIYNKVPQTVWPDTQRSWQRIHIDLLEKDKIKFLILVDHFSKWIEVWPVNKTNSESIIEKLRTCFSIFGLPEVVVSDNGPPFNSSEFKTFLEKNGIKCLHIPPYHSRSNGLAERGVRTIKQMLLKECLDDKLNHLSIQQKLDNILFNYRTTPNSVTGIPPAELILKFSPRTKLTLLKPKINDKLKIKSDKIPLNVKKYSENDKILVKSINDNNIKWVPGIIKKVISPLTYLVLIENRIRFVHIEQIKSTICNFPFFDSNIINNENNSVHSPIPENNPNISPVTPLIANRPKRETRKPERLQLNF